MYLSSFGDDRGVLHIGPGRYGFSAIARRVESILVRGFGANCDIVARLLVKLVVATLQVSFFYGALRLPVIDFRDENPMSVHWLYLTIVACAPLLKTRSGVC